MNWYAIHTKPKKEAIVSRMLKEKEIEIYNPVCSVAKYLKGHYRNVTEPLFPCYIFARFALVPHSWMITYTRGVRKIVGGKDGPWPVAGEIIELIRSSERQGIVPAGSGDLKEGDVLRITCGPFAGLVGILERPLKGSERVILLLSAIEYQARLVVDTSVLARV